MEQEDATMMTEVLTLSLNGELLKTWCGIGDQLCLGSHSQIAEFLIRSYQGKAEDHCVSQRCHACGSALLLQCASCLTIQPFQNTVVTTGEGKPAQCKTEIEQVAVGCQEQSLHQQLEPVQPKQLQVQIVPCMPKCFKSQKRLRQKRKPKALVRSKHAKTKEKEECVSIDRKTRSVARKASGSDLKVIVQDSDGDHSSLDNEPKSVKDFEDVKGTPSARETESFSTAFSRTLDKDNVCLCPVCHKQFATLKLLKTHMYTHDEQRPHVCDTCSKAFRFAYMLKKHKLLHTGQKNFLCNICSKAFAKNDYLKTHMMSHTGLRPHVCDVCGKAFSMACNLKKHKLIHGGIRPHVCDICQKAFTQ